MDLQIRVRDADLPLLDELAEQQWRTPPQQASAMIEQALANARAKANAPERTRGGARRSALPRPTNGVAVAH